ncbi:MAG TPA: hypothetical protein VGZ93_12590 [Candidatus Methylacidiphilales bacterium]|jgi:hypothetical protein|nr:hypothetical protein [Candidatus Methylacidiphilales bacterium]
MTASEIRRELFDVVGFIGEEALFRKITEARRLLFVRSGSDFPEIILIQSWKDDLKLEEAKPLLFMIRAQELYANQFFDEAQAYEALAVKLLKTFS